MDLKSKVAVVTGAGRGIGKAIALALADEGCNVVLVSRTESQLRETEAEIRRKGVQAVAVPADLSSKKEIDKVVEKTIAAFNTVNVLVNNAAVLYGTDFEDVTEEEWDTVMDINLKAPFFLSQAVLSIMKNLGEGYIINISSTAALEVPPPITSYGISKVGMIGMSQALYETAKKYGVKVSVIYPGMTNTEMLRGFDPPVDASKWMLPEDIAGSVIFLLKQSSRVVIRDLVPWAAKHDKI